MHAVGGTLFLGWSNIQGGMVSLLSFVLKTCSYGSSGYAGISQTVPLQKEAVLFEILITY